MEELTVFVRLERNDSTKDALIKMFTLEVGMAYQTFVKDIQNRFELKSDPSSLKLMVKPKISWSEAVPITDADDLKRFMRSIEKGHTEPAISVSLGDSDAADENLESGAFVASNNVDVVDAVRNVVDDVDVVDAVRNVVDDVDVVDVVRNAVDDVNVGNDMQLDTCFNAECLGMVNDNVDLTVNEAELVECGVSTEEERLLQQQKFKEQLLLLDRCVTDAPTESNAEQISVTFSDGSSLRVGKLFATKEEASNSLAILAMKGNFTYKTKTSSKTFLVLKCSVDGCSWGIRLRKLGHSNQFEVRTYNGEHSCGLSSATKVHTNASYEKIASVIVSRYDSGKGPTPKQIQDYIRADLGCEVSYWRAWKARVAAMEKKRGNYELGYAILPDYFTVLKRKNPGTVTALELDGENFKFCFVGIGAALHGFKYLRKVIAVDGTFLTGKYGGVLLCASAQDANGHIYPLAVSVVDSENDASWRWFMEKLKECIPDNDELCFISDRHPSIWKAVAEVYTSAHHGCCAVHLWQNCKVRFRSYWLHTAFEKASKAYTVDQFDMHMESIKKGNEKMSKYLTEKVGVQKWSRAHFPGNRYNLMNTNIAESLNSTLVVEKEFPIYALLVAIQKKLSKWFCDRRTLASNNPALLTPKTAGVLLGRYSESRSMIVEKLNEFEFNVRGLDYEHVVNLERRHCTCRVFNIDRIPCNHAIAALKVVNDGKEMPEQIESLCHRYYFNENWMNAYEMTIYPTPPPEEWFNGVEAGEMKVLPPVKRVGKGRRESKRKPSLGEFGRPPKKRKRCGNCRKEGHYVGKCPKKVIPNP